MTHHNGREIDTESAEAMFPVGTLGSVLLKHNETKSNLQTQRAQREVIVYVVILQLQYVH